jgi:hypothetical protein
MAGIVESLTYLVMHLLKDKRMLQYTPRLNILPLRSLIDMFHNHDATNRSDKVFALLGMSSEASPPIKVDYNKPWKTLFYELIRGIVGDKANILTWDGEEAALIQCFGCVLGRVSNVSKATGFHHHDLVRVESKHFRGPHGKCIEWSASWTIPTTVKPILEDDIVCLLEGALEPTIIRLRKTWPVHEVQFSVVALSIGSPNTVWFPAPFPILLAWEQFLKLVVSFNRTFVLSWHWGFDRALQGPRQWRRDNPHVKHPTFATDPFETLAPEQPWYYTRLCDIVLIYDDLGDRGRLFTLLKTISNAITWPVGQSLTNIAAMVTTHWEAYTELKLQLESVLWGLWMLEEERQWRGTFSDFARFYAEEGNIRVGLFEIASLLPCPLFLSPLRTKSPSGAHHQTVTMSGISRTLLTWPHGSDPALLLWDTIQENDSELSSAMEVVLRKISPSYEVFDRKLRGLQEVLFLATSASTFNLPTRLRNEDPDIQSIGQHIRDSCRLLALFRPRSWTSFDDFDILLSNIARDIHANKTWVGMSASEVRQLSSHDYPEADARTNMELSEFRARVQPMANPPPIAYLNSRSQVQFRSRRWGYIQNPAQEG